MTVETCHNHQTADLQELAVMAMPHAARRVSRALRQPVTLSVSQPVCALPAQQLPVVLPLLVGDLPVSVVRQTFYGGVHGEALVLLTGPNRQQLEYRMDHAAPDAPADRSGLLCQGASLLASACLDGIGRALNAEIVVGAPALDAAHVGAGAVGRGLLARMDTAAWIELRLGIDTSVLCAHLVLLLPGTEMERLSLLLDSFLCSL